MDLDITQYKTFFELNYVNPCRKSAVGEAYDHPWHLDIYKPKSTDFWEEEKSPVDSQSSNVPH